MLRHILISALRNMAANRLLSIIAIAGLAIGIAAAITAGLLIEGWYNFNSFIPGYERTYRVMMPPVRSYGAWSFGIDPRIAPLLKLDLPEVEAAAGTMDGLGEIRHGNVAVMDDVYWAEPNVFSVLSFPVFRGDLKTALTRPDSLTMSRTTARKYFGRDDVVGQTILFRRRPMTVTAVLEDFPASTTFRGNGIFVSNLSPLSPAFAPDGIKAGQYRSSIETYVRLKPNADPTSAAAKAHTAIAPVLAEFPIKGSAAADAPALVRLDRDAVSEKTNPSGTAFMAAIAGLGGLLLFIASVNFVNLLTARAARRATEVGMRKVLGASRPLLIAQFLGEAFVTVFFATCLAAVLVEWLLPQFPVMAQAAPMDYWRDLPLLLALLAAAILLAAAAGAYPAFILSSIRPARVFKGLSAMLGRAGLIRSGLVVLQFSILIILLIGAIVSYQQYRFAIAQPLSVDIDRMLAIHDDCRPALRDELRKLSGIAGVACTGEEFLSNGNTLVFAYKGRQITLNMVRSEPGAFALYGVRPLAGSLQAADATSLRGIVLNQSALRLLGIASPNQAIGKVLTSREELAGRAVTAVVPDFAFHSTEKNLEATVFVPMTFKGRDDMVSVKFNPGDASATLKAIDRTWAATGGEGQILRFFLDQHMRDYYNDMLQSAAAFTIAAVLAMVLACIGLTGLSIAAAERRTKEIGVRKAMGAGNTQLVGMLLLQFAKPVLWANLIAWPLAWWAGQMVLAGFARHVPLQPWVFVAASAMALLLALLAVGVHAILAARQKPVLALRYE